MIRNSSRAWIERSVPIRSFLQNGGVGSTPNSLEKEDSDVLGLANHPTCRSVAVKSLAAGPILQWSMPKSAARGFGIA